MAIKHFSLYHAVAILSDEKSQRQDQIENNKKKNSTRHKQIIFALSGVVIFVGIFLFYTFYLHAENSVYVYEDYFQIRGTYGAIVNFSEISDLILVEKSMEEIGIPRRSNGVVTDSILKGKYLSDSQDSILLFVRQHVAPTIQIIRVNEGNIYLSFSDPEKTNDLFLELRGKLSHAIQTE